MTTKEAKYLISACEKYRKMLMDDMEECTIQMILGLSSWINRNARNFGYQKCQEFAMEQINDIIDKIVMEGEIITDEVVLNWKPKNVMDEIDRIVLDAHINNMKKYATSYNKSYKAIIRINAIIIPKLQEIAERSAMFE